jgi:hypothetical protein
MAIAETAKMIADLELRDHVSGPAKSAEASMRGVEAQTERTTQRFAGLHRVTSGIGGGLSHLKGQISGLAGSVGLLGLGGGVIGLTKFIKDSADAATQMGDTVLKLTAITGASTDEASRFTDAFDKMGISADKQIRVVGFLTKTLGTLTETHKSAIAIQKQYGFSLLDSTGHAKSAMQVIQDLGDYWNSNAKATDKAGLSAKLLGRGYTDMIPILKLGGQGIRAAEADAMSLSKSDIEQLKQWKSAQRDLADSMGDLKVKVGLVLIPVLRDLFNGISSFIDEHQGDIVKFFIDGGRMARVFGQYLSQTVIPAIRDLATGAQNLWNGIPAPLRDLLVKGIVADRTIKYLFGFSISGVAGGLVKDLVGGMLGGIAGKLGLSRGSSPANPMYVSGGGLGGTGGGTGGSGGGSFLGRLGTVLTVALAAGSIIDLANQIGVFVNDLGHEQADLQKQADNAGTGKTSQQAMSDLSNFVASMKDTGFLGIGGLIKDTVGGKQEIDALTNLGDAIVNNSKLNTDDTVKAIGILSDAQQQAVKKGNADAAKKLGDDITTLQNRLKAPLTTANAKLQAIADKPTKVGVTVNTNVTSTVSTRDVQSQENVTSRYGFVAT